MELAAAPLILFLDEPTTGLDASSALEVCEVLNKIAKLTAINVAVVIHQPRVEIWNSLDNLLILAPGGKTVLAASGGYKGILRVPYILISAAPREFIIPQKGLFMNIAIGLAAATAGVRTFGDERVIYWREAASGHNRASYFLGVTLSVLYRIALAALHFVIMLYVVGMPMQSLGRIYLICFGIYFAVYGLGSLISMIFDRKDAPLTAVIATLIAAIMSGFITFFPYQLKAISYAFWSSEAYYAGEVAPFRSIYDIDASSAAWDYNINRFTMDIGLMICLGVGYRIISFILMVLLRRDKQK